MFSRAEDDVNSRRSLGDDSLAYGWCSLIGSGVGTRLWWVLVVCVVFFFSFLASA